MTNRKWVTLHILWKAVSSHLLLWLTACEWHCTICESKSHLICSYDQQLVSDIAQFLKGSLISSFPANRKWVMLHMCVRGSLITSFPCPTVCEWSCTFYEWQSHHIFFSNDQQGVSDIAHFVKGSLIPSSPMTNSKWVRLHNLWTEVSSHLFLWPTGSEWHCTICERESHHIFSYDQQQVSEIAHFVNGSLITSFPMTNSEWVTLHILWKGVSSHLFLWTASQWNCTFVKGSLITFFSSDQQSVSDIAHFVKGSLITPFPMTNSKWVILHILCSLITSFPITNSKWVTLDMLWKSVSWHLFLWPTGCEWHCTCCERQWSHHSFSYD